MRRFVTMVAVLAMAAPGCSMFEGVGTKQGVGAAAGAGAGALAGSQIGQGRGRMVAVAVGTLAGALLGSEIGKSLDRADKLAMERNAQYGLEYARTSQSTEWVNPDSGNSGTITPQRTYTDTQGRYCREYTQTIVIDDEPTQATGKACRESDGRWVIVE